MTGDPSTTGRGTTGTGSPPLDLQSLLASASQDAYDLTIRRRLADQALKERGDRFPPGTEERDTMLLKWMSNGLPTPATQAAYFENLRLLLRDRPRRTRPGQLVIGMGTGRSGSTSLSQIVSTCADTKATHECPPMLFWTPEPEQIAVHLARFELLREHFALVFDVAHWWLNAVDVLVEKFPDVRFIGTSRQVDQCVASFLRVKGVGPGSLNHWLPRGTAGARNTAWDPTYPSYPVADPAEAQSLSGKQRLIERYVREYNARMKEMADADPGRWLQLDTDTLHRQETQQRIFDHSGVQGTFTTARWNATINAG